MQVCDKLQASQDVLKAEPQRGPSMASLWVKHECLEARQSIPSPAQPVPHRHNPTEDRASLALPDWGCRGATADVSTLQHPMSSHAAQDLWSCFVLKDAGWLALLLLRWQRRHTKSSREGTEQFLL